MSAPAPWTDALVEQRFGHGDPVYTPDTEVDTENGAGMFVNIEDTDRDEARRFVYDGRLFTGDVVETDRTGNVIGRTPVRNGVAHGIGRDWYPDGTLRTEMTLVDGGVVDVSRHWHPNGQLAEERIFDDKGIVLKMLRWAEDGSPVPGPAEL